MVLGGLKLQVTNDATPPHDMFTVPSPLAESTVKVIEPELPRATVSWLPLAATWIGAPTWVGSLAVWLLGSPPPETVAELVTEAGALLATLTVRVMTG